MKYNKEINLFVNRHIGVSKKQELDMLETLGCENIDELIRQVIPAQILTSNIQTTQKPMLNEFQGLTLLKQIASQNKQYKNCIGMGYYDTITPSVIKRNVLENPGWYTAYTPYQAEISQGRLEALLNFQQMIMDLTGFNLANASLLDEGTAAAEAVLMSRRINPNADSKYYLIDHNVFPQTIEVIRTKAKYQGIDIIVGDVKQIINNPTEHLDIDKYFGVLLQNPNLYGQVNDYSSLITKIKQVNSKCVVTMVYDILSMVLFKSPATMGANIAVGSTQRFGIPLGYGGPHAAYFATDDQHKRIVPGRVIGVSQDSYGKKALRMALQTREQHIRREKATSNICTAQVLLANMAGFYAVYHGYQGLKKIASNIMILAHSFADALINLLQVKLITSESQAIFDTVCFKLKDASNCAADLKENGYLVAQFGENILSVSFGESFEPSDVINIIRVIARHCQIKLNDSAQAAWYEKYFVETDSKSSSDVSTVMINAYNNLYRTDNILQHSVFDSYHSETKMMRYLKQLENKDISLVHSMIALGSCTMKLNAVSQLEGVSWPEFSNVHPLAPLDTVEGYNQLITQLAKYLQDITGFSAISLQPNSGAQGEYTGLLAIRRYHESISQVQRDICLIPKSAHGTNPATAQIMGYKVVVVNCDDKGNVDMSDLKAKAEQYKDTLACLMITYPSTHGVFEANIIEICEIIHKNGGQVYMDGANLNAMVGLVKPADLGVDVSHMNLHKTFAIPHGGGGPGMGPIGVREHLVKFLPGHIFIQGLSVTNTMAVSSAPYGSASILVISWMYITLLGQVGLKRSTQTAILNANYIAHKLSAYYPILYTGQNSRVAHECIIDLRPLKQESGVSEVDIAKRLMDYGFHSPTMSFPVAGTLMIEPTESEDKEELDRFIQAMINIHQEIQDVISNRMDKLNNPFKNAPHTYTDIMSWDKPYSVEVGCFPLAGMQQAKVFPSVNRIDDAYGDRNFICSCGTL